MNELLGEFDITAFALVLNGLDLKLLTDPQLTHPTLGRCIYMLNSGVGCNRLPVQTPAPSVSVTVSLEI